MFFKRSSAIALCMSFALVSAQMSAGTITGKINFKGNPPSTQPIKMNADPKCVKLHGGKDVSSDQVIVNPNKTLRWVFVYVKKGLEGKKFPAPSAKVTVDQKGCMYSPHVFGAVVNQPIEIVNSDATLHNIHALPKINPQFNIAQPKQGMKMTKSFAKAEAPIKIKCEVHNWMASYAHVLEHPFFAVSDEQGNFSIKNLPAGEYEIEAWHEKFGTQTFKVSVGASDTKTADFTFESK